MRPVPDNQEVFTDPDARVSIIIDILDVSPASEQTRGDMSLGEFHWDIVHNEEPNAESTINVLHDADVLPAQPFSMIAARGGHHSTRDGVHTYLGVGVGRLEQVDADIVVQLFDELQSVGGHVGNSLRTAERARALIESVQVHDWSLFST